MIHKYKLIDQKGYTRHGQEGETFWLDGQEKEAQGKGSKLCSTDVIHFYNDPIIAIIMNPTHANIPNPRLIEIEIDEIVAPDELKGGCKKAKFIKEIPVPEVSLNQKVRFAIQLALFVSKHWKSDEWVKWAELWLQQEATAEAATSTADVAWAVAEAACTAAWAAETARAAWAAWAAARAAEAVWAVEAIWAAAETAAEAVAWAADVARTAEVKEVEMFRKQLSILVQEILMCEKKDKT